MLGGICDTCHALTNDKTRCRACRMGDAGVWIVGAVVALAALLGVLQ